MSLTKTAKQDLIDKYKQSEHDTASPHVQVALLTARLQYLNEHFKTNNKDHHSRRGLMKIVGRRRRLLNYLQAKDHTSYKKLITDLGIRK